MVSPEVSSGLGRQQNEQKVAKEAKEENGRSSSLLTLLPSVHFFRGLWSRRDAKFVEHGRQISRQRGDEFYRFAGRRMCQLDPAGVKGLARKDYVFVTEEEGVGSRLRNRA